MTAQAEAASHRVLVTLINRDHGLFDALDTNQDGQLGRRELRHLVDRLTAWDRNGDGQLAFEEAPRLYSIEVAQDVPRIPPSPFGFVTGSFVVNRLQKVAVASRPIWFTQMDRNSDGDISRREFLGAGAIPATRRRRRRADNPRKPLGQVPRPRKLSRPAPDNGDDS